MRNRTRIAARLLYAGLTAALLASLRAHASDNDLHMGPGSGASGVSTRAGAQHKSARVGPIEAGNALSVDIPAPKRVAEPSDPRLDVVGKSRLFADAGKPDLDATALAWAEQGSDLVATVRIESPGALQLRVGLRFDGAHDLGIRVASLGGAAVEVNGETVSAAAKSGVLWTPLTDGDVQLVEFSVPRAKPLEAGQVRIIGVSHLERRVGAGVRGLEKATLPIGQSLSCQINTACVANASDLDPVIKQAFDNKVNATALMLVTKDDGNTVYCSGTLISNDYRAALFMTAFHCVGSANEANSLITVWKFQTVDCAGNQYYTGDFRVNGGLLLGANQELDQALVGLRDDPPSYSVLSGWDASGSLTGAGTLMLGMHHPRGDLKKTSVGTITGILNGGLTVAGMTHAPNEFYTTGWQVGLVEPGSSGSGLFVHPPGTDYLALVGTLFAGPSTSLTCAAASTYTNYFARLDLFYPSVRRFFKSSYSSNYTDLWWNASESGWGLNIQHQGETLFATWFTYDSTGAGMWLVMSNGTKQSDGSYAGALYQTTGTPFNQINGAPALDLPVTQVGSASLSFSGANSGTFSYTVGGISGSKAITRQQFSTPASCSFTMGARSTAGNYQDLWYNSSEPGWGVNIAHQGSTLFATWFTYDSNRKGMWLVMSAGQLIAPNTYQGTLYRTTGKPFNQINGSIAVNLPLQSVGTLTFQFQDGETGVMSYTVNGISGSKHIERQVFALPMSKCQ